MKCVACGETSPESAGGVNAQGVCMDCVDYEKGLFADGKEPGKVSLTEQGRSYTGAVGPIVTLLRLGFEVKHNPLYPGYNVKPPPTAP